MRLTTAGEAGAAAAPRQRASYMLSRTALRPCFAAVMARLRRGKARHFPTAEIILDPMCGCGAIGTEVAAGSSGAFVLNGDICPKDVERLRCNALRFNNRSSQTNTSSVHSDNRANSFFSGNMGRLEGSLWDAARLPLRTGSMDSLITDLPWGKAVGSREQNTTLYPAVMREVVRVLRPGGLAVLLTKDKLLMKRALETAWGFEGFVQPWGPPRMVNIGGLRAALYTLERSGVDWAELPLGKFRSDQACSNLQPMQLVPADLASGLTTEVATSSRSSSEYALTLQAYRGHCLRSLLASD